MIATADHLARRHGLSREAVDRYACASHQRALQAQRDGAWAEEIVTVDNQVFELEGYQPRGIRLARRAAAVTQDSHPRPTDLAALARLRAVHANGVQTAGNSCAVVDGAAAALVGRASACPRPPLARLLASAVVGVAPEFMGIGPAPAIRLLLHRSGLSLDDIGRFEINEAQAAQVLAVAQELELDSTRLNVQGGSLAVGHPLAASRPALGHDAGRAITPAQPALRDCRCVRRRWAGHGVVDREPGLSRLSVQRCNSFLFDEVCHVELSGAPARYAICA